MQGSEGHLRKVGRNHPEYSLGLRLKKMEEKTKQKTRMEKEKLPLEVTQFVCCLSVSNLPRKEHVVHYIVVITLFYHEKGRF